MKTIGRTLGENLITLILIPSVLFSIVSFFILDKLISARLEETQDTMVSLIEESIRSNIENPVQEIREAITLIEKGIIQDEEIPEFLNTLVQLNPLFVTVYILDDEGILSYSPDTDSHLIGNDYSRYLTSSSEGNGDAPYWSSTFVSSEYSEITYAFSLEDKYGKSFFGFVSLESLQNLVDSLSRDSSAKIAVINDKRFYLAHSDFDKVEQRAQEHLIDLNKEHQKISIDGQKQIVLTEFLPDLKMHIVLFENYRNYNIPLFVALFVNFSMIGFIVLLVLIYVRTQGRKITTQMNLVIKGAAEILKENYQFEIAESSYREINALATAYRYMSERISGAIKDLSDSKEKLSVLNASLESQNKKIRRNEEELQLVMDSSFDGILFMDQDYIIKRISQSARELFHLSSDTDQVIGKTCHSLFMHKNELCLSCKKQNTRDLGVVYNGSYDYEGRLIEETSIPIFSEGKVHGIIVTFRDITEKSDMERKLNHAMKMEAVGRLAGGIAHDFNNILQVILGYSDLISQTGEESERFEYLDQINQTTERAQGLVRQLLTFCRLDRIQKEELQLDSIISGMMDMLQRLIGESLVLETDLRGGNWYLLGDKNQLEQVLVNLVVNARDAMKGQGCVSIRTYIEQNQQLNQIVMEVKDQGTGIPKEIQDKIFEPFFSTKELGKGTGLGLSTVFGIVESFEGTIDVDSKNEEGTTFRLSFPALRQLKV